MEQIRIEQWILDDALRVAEIGEHEAFKGLLRFLKEARRDVGLQALHDDAHSRDYWRGYCDGLDQLSQIVSSAVELGKARAEAKETRESEASMRSLLIDSLKGGEPKL